MFNSTNQHAAARIEKQWPLFKASYVNMRTAVLLPARSSAAAPSLSKGSILVAMHYLECYVIQHLLFVSTE